MKSYQDKAGRTIQILEETDVLVIGAGLGGICAALSAASTGYHVVLAEKNAVLGGQAAEIDTWGLDGFVNRNGKLVVKGYPWKILQETVKEGGSDPLFENIDLDVMEKQGIDQALHAINLDEYKGLSPENDQSYRYFMNTNLFDHVNIDKTRTFVPNGLEPDSQKACNDYNQIIQEKGPIDLQLLGLGHNGHIGFNEPGEAFEKETHCVDLTESTIEANKRFFESENDVPKQAYTMGIKNIMQAKKILVVVSGADKADILKEVLYGPITPEVPASILQLHNDVTIVADEAALSKIDK